MVDTPAKIVLKNDDVHTFEYVIDALMYECDHDEYQAEQCAYLTHFKGECEIKFGKESDLRGISGRLEELGLDISLELITK